MRGADKYEETNIEPVLNNLEINDGEFTMEELQKGIVLRSYKKKKRNFVAEIELF